MKSFKVGYNSAFVSTSYPFGMVVCGKTQFFGCGTQIEQRNNVSCEFDGG